MQKLFNAIVIPVEPNGAGTIEIDPKVYREIMDSNISPDRLLVGLSHSRGHILLATDVKTFENFTLPSKFNNKMWFKHQTELSNQDANFAVFDIKHQKTYISKRAKENGLCNSLASF